MVGILFPFLLRIIFLIDRIFPFELTWVLTQSPKTLSDETVHQGLVCAHMHSFFFCVPQLDLWGSPLLGEIFAYVTVFFNLTIKVVTFRLRGYMHSIARTQKILTFMSWMGECWQQKHTQTAPSSTTKCDYLNGWIKKTFTYAKKSHPKQ